MRALSAAGRGLLAVLVFFVRLILHMPPEQKPGSTSERRVDDTKDESA